MIELRADLWTVPTEGRCITTNGYVRNDGKAVMGRGCALQAVRRYPSVAGELGRRILATGNRVYNLGEYDGVWLFAFPVKHVWWQPADLTLIQHSAVQLVEITNIMRLNRVVLPKPGCGNGQLTWDCVRPVLEVLLDDRFTIVDL